jgi:hypothetical protein
MVKRISILALTIGLTLDLSAYAQSNNVSAAQQITGAFGVVLGTRVNLAAYTKAGETQDKTPLYSFAPKSPIQGFTHYYFAATPKTGIIYEVWAAGDCESAAVCNKQRAVVLDLLKKKYGPEDKPQLFQDLYDADIITRGDRYIMVKCTGIMSITINLRYCDSNLEKQAEKERIELEGKKTDDSGL